MTGELATRSAANMTGYFEMPAATAEAIDADGFLRTGDAGYLDADGYLYLQDRVKDMIISGGENIYPAEVENAIYGHPSVAEVAVIGIPDAKWGEVVRAVIVPVAGVVQNDVDVIAWAAARIARYKLPKSIEWVSALPRNHTGKVLRRVLRDARRG
jgi:long-chain acyl-CoA synthetase